ncbi:hypothetical protein PAXINDRAFT_159934 [Paxillus involutus ATCC 200175]|nr:hypothetical protein PAXINDRAFT_159934 [Paxillus involutus ATCC 200175]
MSTPKLTKRQKKGVAFRERKQGKGKGKLKDTTDDLENNNDVPILEDQVLADDAQGPQSDQGDAEALVGKAKQRDQRDERETGMGVAAKKRKWEVSEEEQETNRESTKRGKRSHGDAVVDMGQVVEGEGEGEGEKEAKKEEEEKPKQRFILFLGNLKYTTTAETIQAHFSVCDPPPTIRLLTPKQSTTKAPIKVIKPVIKSKGCAFLEFKHRNALQQGLKLHHSQLDGRQINVELTAGGGGKGEARLEKLKGRNKELEGQRRKRQEKKLSDDSKPKEQPEGAQRFSATSGVEQVHTKKRTWTVGDVEETETHRGGHKHTRGSRKRKPGVKDFGTGVNAIQIG